MLQSPNTNLALFLQSQNTILAPTFTKPKYYFGTYFLKAQILFLTTTHKAQNTLTPIYKSPSHRRHELLLLKPFS